MRGHIVHPVPRAHSPAFDPPAAKPALAVIDEGWLRHQRPTLNIQLSTFNQKAASGLSEWKAVDRKGRFAEPTISDFGQLSSRTAKKLSVERLKAEGSPSVRHTAENLDVEG
jgi:hypothetical protein